MRRRGFTLIELAVSLGVVGILTTALASSIMISLRTLPTEGGLAERQAATGETLVTMGDDIRLATYAMITNARRLALTVPDRTGDNSDDAIVYEWSGVAGEPLTRNFNGEGETNLLSRVVDFNVSQIADSAITARDRTIEPSDRVRILVQSGTNENVSASAEYRFLNCRIDTAASSTPSLLSWLLGGGGGGGGDDDD